MIDTLKRTILLAAALLLVTGCKKHNYSDIPAYLHLDKMDVVDKSGSGAPAGFFTSEIDAVQLIAYWEGDEAETILGTFQLPCTIPVMRNETITRLDVVPVIKQNGIAATRIEYPYFKYVYLTDVPLAADSTTNLGTQDSTGIWVLSTEYKPWRQWSASNTGSSDTLITVMAEEYFEKIQYSILFTSPMDRIVDNADVRTGTGSGMVHVTRDKDAIDFEIDKTIEVNDPTKNLYLEMDYRTDVKLSVGMRSSYRAGGTEDTQSAITLYETNGKWRKIYINLGRLWSQFNYNSTFHVVFSALNSDGVDGYVYLDNVKLLTI